MARRIQLQSGRIVEFGDDWNDQQIRSYILQNYDASEIAEDAGMVRGASDFAAQGGAALLDTIGGAADLAATDQAAPIMGADTVGGRIERAMRDVPVIGGYLNAGARAVEVGENAVSALGRGAAGLMREYGPDALAPVANMVDVGANEVQREQLRRRQEENDARAARGEQSLESETQGTFAQAFADQARGMADDARGALSEESKVEQMQLGESFDQGIGSGLRYALTNPLDTFNAIGPEVAAFMVGGGIAGRGAKTLGATDELATAISLQGQGAAAAELNASGAADVVRNLSDERIAELPMGRELMQQGMSAAQAREEMARRAYDAAFGVSAPTNAALMGLTQKLNLNPVETAVVGGKGFGNRVAAMEGLTGRGARAATAGTAEGAGEFVEEAADQFGQNVGEIAGGAREGKDVLEGTATAGVMGALVGGAMGGGLGLMTGPDVALRVAKERTNVPTDLRDPAGQGEADVRAMWAAAMRGEEIKPQSAVVDNGDGTVTMGASTISGPDAMATARRVEEQERAQAAPGTQPATPAAPVAKTPATRSLMGEPADDLEAQLQAAGAAPRVALGEDPASAAFAQQNQPAPSPSAESGESPQQVQAVTGQAAPQSRRAAPPPALLPAANRPPPPTTVPRNLQPADLVTIPPAQTGYAKGVRPMEIGEDAKPYLKKNIDTLPDPKPGQLPVDTSARYFSSGSADSVVPLSALKPSKVEEPGNAAIKRMAATAAGVIARRDPIDVEDNGDGTYTIVDGNGSYNAARKIGLADMPVRIVKAPQGKEPWRQNRGMLTPEQDAQLLSTYEQAAAELPSYDKTLKSLALNLGGQAVVAPLKGRTRAEQKIRDDYRGDVTQIKDLLRGTLKFATPQQAIDAANKLRAQFEMVKDKDGLSPGTPDKGFGYRDINMVIRMPGGTLAEVQLMTTAMAKAKSEAHKHYDVTRALQEKFEKGTATAAEKKAYAAAEAAMWKAYEEAAALDSDATNSARVTGDQESGLRQSTASTPLTGDALPDGENLTPEAGGGDSRTNANTSPSLRSMNTQPLPAGGTVTPSNTSATGGSPVSGDGPIVRAVQAVMQALGIPETAVTFGGTPAKMFGEEGARALGLDARTEGVYIDGRVIIFQDNIANQARAIWVFLHEHSGHHGVRSLLGDRYATVMNYAASNPLVKAIADDMRREAEEEAEAGAEGARDLDDPNLFTEEALVELQAAVVTGDFGPINSRYPSTRSVKRESAPGLIQRVINAIKAALGKAGAPKMTDAEVAQLLRDARKQARATPVRNAAGAATQSRAERPLVGDRTDVRSLPEGPSATVAAVTMQEALSMAESRKWEKGRDLKLALQEESQRRQREAGINLEERTQASYRVLVDSVVAEARDAMTKFSNAIGWYDTKTAQALAQIALVHPEIETDKRSRVAFVWALAITSNGQKVEKNFEMAEAAYRRWREDGVMPADIGIGIPGKAINNGLAMYNDLSRRMSPEVMEKMLVTRFTVGEIAGATGIKPGGEAINTPVRGAAIAGPKIGNGFMSNLMGYFDQLTVDRWFMRTWGRMIGKLVEVDQADVARKRRDLSSAVRALSAADAETLRGLVGDIAISNDEQVDALSARINAATVKKEAREALMASEPLEVIRLRGRALNNALDGSIEAPSGPDQREYIRAVFGEALETLQRDNPGLTMADLQAVLWYPEKRLYERAKKDVREEEKEQEEEEGYADDDAPDYANAARDLVLSKGVPSEQVERAMREFTPSSQTAPKEMTEQEKADFLATYIAPPEQDFSFIFEVAPDPADAEAMANWSKLDAKAKKQITSSVGAAVIDEVSAALGIEQGTIKKPVTAMGGFRGEVNSNQIAAFPKTKVTYDQALAFAAVVGDALDQASVVVVDERAPSRNNAIRVAVATGKMEPHASSVWAEITSKIPSLAGEGFTVRGDSLEFLHWTDVSNADMAQMVQSAIDSMEIQTAVSFGEINSTLVERPSYAEQIDGLRPELREDVRALARDIRSRTKQRIADAAAAAADAGRDGAGAARRRGVGARQSRAAVDGQPGVRRDDAGQGAVVPPVQVLQSRAFPADAPAFRQRKQQADAVSAQGIHYSGAAGLTALDAKFAGSGSAGAERRRFGMGQYGANAAPGDTGRRLYFYVQEGDAPPRKEDVVAGNNRYAVNLTNLYDVEADPRGLREEAGSNPDYLEELVNDAGFDGILLPPLPGIDGKTAILHGLKKKVPVVSAPMQSRAPAKPQPGVPTPLYADRPVVNDGGLRQWAIDAGLTDVLPAEEMHVTVTYSRAPVDVADVAPDEAGLAVRPAGRAVQLRSALAMPVASMALQRGHRRYRDAGASHDYGDQYTPHITLKYDPTPEDIAALEAAPRFTGTIQLGPERQDVLKPQGQPLVMQSRSPDLAARFSDMTEIEVTVPRVYYDLEFRERQNFEEHGEPIELGRTANSVTLRATVAAIANMQSMAESDTTRNLDDRLAGVSQRALKSGKATIDAVKKRLAQYDAERGAPMQSRAPQTREFREWFAGSAITSNWESGEDAGSPRRLYHATAASFDEFRIGADATDPFGRASGPVIFMTDDPQDQRAWHNIRGNIDDMREGVNVMPLYASIKNPLFTDEKQRDSDVEKFGLSRGWPYLYTQADVDVLTAAGYDGVVMFNDEAPTEVVAFRKDQVKSIFNDRPTSAPGILQSRAPTKEARATAKSLRERKSQLARELTEQNVTVEQIKAWTNKARLLIGEVGASPDFAREIAEAKRELTPERRDALQGDRTALNRYDEIRDMIGMLDAGQRAVRAKALEANRLLDKVERRTSTMSLTEREQLLAELGESLDKAEQAYIAAKAIADWRAKNDFKIVKAYRKRNEVLSYLASEGYQQGSMPWGTGPLLAKKDKALRKIRRVFQDRLIDLRDVQEQIENEIGRSIDDMQNVYRAENQMHGKTADAIQGFHEKMRDPLIDSINATGLSLATVERYLWAKHARERNAKIAAIRPGVNDGSGMTNDEADAIIGAFTPEQIRKLDAVSSKVQEVRRFTLSTMVQSGQIDQKSADAMLNAYADYVPLRGKDEVGDERVGQRRGTGQGISAGGTGIVRALGRKTPPKNILAELVGDAERSIVQAGKAEVGRALLRMALSYPNPEIWEIQPVELKPTLNEATGEVYLAVTSTAQQDADSIVVKHNGKPYRIMIKHPQLRDALRNTGVEGAEWFVRYFGAINRWFSAVFTRFNPGFVPINLMRDLTLGLTGVAAELGSGSAGKISALYFQSFGASYRQALRQSGDASKPNAEKTLDDWAREAAEAGMKSGWTALDDMDTLQRDIENSMRGVGLIAKTGVVGIDAAATYAKMAKDKVVAGFEWIEAVNDGVENGLRLATYIHLRRDKGWTKAKAAEYAKELTVNFNRKGMAGSIINSMYLFYNAAVQGSRRTLQIMRHPKTQGTLAVIGVAQFTLAATLGAAKFGDDEDDETLWEKIPDHVKRRSFVIPTGFGDDGSAQYIAIPMPFGFNAVPAVAGYAANYTNPRWVAKQGGAMAMAGSAIGYTMSTVIDALSPIAVGEEDAFWPTIVQMGMQAAANRDSLGRTIAPSDTFNQYEVPRAEMYKPGTFVGYVWAARALNRLGLGDQYTPPRVMAGILDVSPNDLEFLVGQLLGGPGNIANQTWRMGALAIGGEEIKASDIPIVRTIVGDQRREISEVRAFYDNKDSIERGLDRMRDAFVQDGERGFYEMRAELGPAFADVGLKIRKEQSEDGRFSAGEPFVNERTGNPTLVSPDGTLLAEYRAAKKELSELNAAVRRVYNDRSLTSAQRQAEIMRINREKGDAVKNVNRLTNRLAAMEAGR